MEVPYMDPTEREQRLRDLRIGWILDGLNQKTFSEKEGWGVTVVANVLKRYFYTGNDHTGLLTDKILKRLRYYSKRGRKIRLAAMKHGY